MKPNFALNFTETSISLLHRTAKGWTVVGETPFDAPDLAEALDYLRKTALGLEPGGITTKLVIPNSQILYSEVAAPGPSEDERRAQIATELEGRTPYKADEIAFDFAGRGKVVKVAAVARETLDEAESFAVQHRFNPVSFVALPEGGYAGEPWFGMTAAAKAMLAPGEVVERDRSPIALPGPRGSAASLTEPAEAPPEALIQAEAAPPAAPASPPAPAASSPAAPPPAAPASAASPPAASTPPRPAAAPAMAAPPMGASAGGAAHGASQSGAPRGAPDPAPAAPRPEPAPTALRRDEPAPVPPPPPLGARPAEPAPPAFPAPAPAAPGRPAAEAPGDEAPFTHVGDGGISADALPPGDLPPLPAAAAAAAAAPVRSAALAARSVGVAATSLPDEDDDLPPAPSTAALAAFNSRRAAESLGAPGTNGAPALPASTRPDAAALARAARGKPIEELPPVPRPAQAAPAPATGVGGGLAALKSAARGAAAPGSVAGGVARGLGALVNAPSIPGARKSKQKPGALPPAAARTAAAAPGAAGGPAPSASEAARSLARSPFATPPRGRPRHLGLILTAILLLCLALVAAWSSLYLSAADDPEAPVYASATDAGDIPAIEDEMLADAQDPDTLGPLDPAAEDPAADLSADLATDLATDLAAAPAPAETAMDQTAETAPEPTADPALAAPPGTLPADELAAADPALSLSTAETATGDLVQVEAAPDTGLNAGSPDAVALVDAQDEIFLAGPDVPPPAFDALSLPPPDAAVDALPPPPMPPPPPGTVYSFGADGLIVPMPEGIPSPAGFMLYAGKPDLVPPPRSPLAEAAAAAAAEAAAVAAVPPATPAPGQSAALIAPDPAADPAAAAVPAGPEAQPDPDLADRRPRPRPPELVPATAEDDAALSPDGATQFASLRPRERPPTVLAASERARAETAGASLASPAEPADPAVVEPAALSASDATNPSLLAISRRPAEKPKDFSRAVEAAVAAAVRAPEPEPEPAPSQTAAAKPPGDAVKPDEQSEIDEPEVVAASAAPKIPTKASVAKQATFKNAINLSKTNLIGVYGTQSKRYALVRLSSGKYKKVKVGDRIDGGTIQAITQTEVRYQKGGRLVTLAMPKG